jgi:glycosyltransferase involved in cell wall biosynthesis
MKKVLITMPVYNEEKCLAKSIKKLDSYLQHTKFPYTYTIVIADNASIDNTPKIGKSLQNSRIKYLRLERKGRGFALKKAWTDAIKSKYDVACYMDVDLSTDLRYIRPLIDAIVVDKYDVAIGNRLGKHSKVIGRHIKREILSRFYNLILRVVFFSSIADFQCGFKAVNLQSFKKLVKETENNKWFFDTELILLACKRHMRVKPIDVKWVDDYDSRVKIVSTVSEYLRAIIRIRLKFWREMFAKKRS